MTAGGSRSSDVVFQVEGRASSAVVEAVAHSPRCVASAIVCRAPGTRPPMIYRILLRHWARERAQDRRRRAGRSRQAGDFVLNIPAGRGTGSGRAPARPDRRKLLALSRWRRRERPESAVRLFVDPRGEQERSQGTGQLAVSERESPKAPPSVSPLR